MSYSKFDYSEITLHTKELTENDELIASVIVTNMSNSEGEEVVESKTVTFTITSGMISFHRADMTYGTEPCDSHLLIGGNSRNLKQASFSLK